MSLLFPQDTDKQSELQTIPQPQQYHNAENDDSFTSPTSSMKFFWLTIVILLVVTGVGVGTYLLESDRSEPLLVNTLLTPTPNSLTPNERTTIVNDPTAKWMSYVNNEHNFSMKYPPQSNKTSEDEHAIIFSSPSATYSLVFFPFLGSLEDLYEERTTNIVTKDSNIPIVFPDLPQEVKKTALIDGSKAYWYETVFDFPKGKTGKEVHFIHHNTGFIFHADPEVIVSDSEMEQIIMTFKNIPLEASMSAKSATLSGKMKE